MTKELHVVARRGPDERLESIVTPSAIVFIADLVAAFRPRLMDIAAKNRDRGAAAVPSRRRGRVASASPSSRSADVRTARWRCSPIPRVLERRRVELVGPADRLSLLGAIDAAPDVYVADFDASMSPTWKNVIDGQLALYEAIRGTLSVETAGLRRVQHGPPPPILFRPRPLDQYEDRVVVQGRAAPAALFDVGLYCFHNAKIIAAKGAGPFFSLTKLRGRLEARLWNDALTYLERAVGIAPGTFKVSVRVDTVQAAFEMHEILWELRERCAGLACGRWEYLHDLVMTRATDPHAVMSDRDTFTVDQAPLAACADRIVATCRERHVSAIGPIRNDAPSGTDHVAPSVLGRIRTSGFRQAARGFDVMRVAHPVVVEAARASFDIVDRSTPSKSTRSPNEARAESSERDLLRVPRAAPSEASVRENIRIALVHLDAWLAGRGRIARQACMEDSASARASRALLWHWVRHYVRLSDEKLLTRELFRELVAEEASALESSERAVSLLERVCLARRLEPISSTDLAPAARTPGTTRRGPRLDLDRAAGAS